MQDINEINRWYSTPDPWEYEKNEDDLRRRDYLLKFLKDKKYNNVLDIGCGNGFITDSLPGLNITGVDLSDKAIEIANSRNEKKNIKYLCKSVFNISELNSKFDLIIITGVLYEHYLGNSRSFIYSIINDLLIDNGTLISVHIDNWYKFRFPFLLTNEFFYDYRELIHRLEIYRK